MQTDSDLTCGSTVYQLLTHCNNSQSPELSLYLYYDRNFICKEKERQIVHLNCLKMTTVILTHNKIKQHNRQPHHCQKAPKLISGTFSHQSSMPTVARDCNVNDFLIVFYSRTGQLIRT